MLEHKDKAIKAVYLRLKDAKGLWIGDSGGTFYRRQEIGPMWDGFTRDATTGLQPVEIDDGPSFDSTIRIQKRSPELATVLGYVVELNVAP